MKALALSTSIKGLTTIFNTPKMFIGSNVFPEGPVVGGGSVMDSAKAGWILIGCRSRDRIHGMGQDIQTCASGELGRHGHTELWVQYSEIRKEFVMSNGDLATGGIIMDYGNSRTF